MLVERRNARRCFDQVLAHCPHQGSSRPIAAVDHSEAVALTAGCSNQSRAVWVPTQGARHGHNSTRACEETGKPSAQPHAKTGIDWSGKAIACRGLAWSNAAGSPCLGLKTGHHQVAPQYLRQPPRPRSAPEPAPRPAPIIRSVFVAPAVSPSSSCLAAFAARASRRFTVPSLPPWGPRRASP